MSTTTTTTIVTITTTYSGVMTTIIIGVFILVTALVIKELCNYRREPSEPLSLRFKHLGTNVLIAIVPMLVVFGLVIWYKTYWALH